MLASTLIPQPHSMIHAPLEEDVKSFGSMLLRGLTMSENDGDLETCCRAASVLSYVLKDNIQYKEKDLLNQIAALAGDSSKTGGAGGSSHSRPQVNGSSERIKSEALHRDLQVVYQQLEILKMEKNQTETDLKSLSDAYNSLEQANYHLENKIKALKAGGAMSIPDVDSIKAEVREESQKESEAELNDLVVCLRQGQSKVEKLSARLLELGEDGEQLLEGIGDDIEVPEDEEDEEDEED